jgi:hypothetical protein
MLKMNTGIKSRLLGRKKVRKLINDAMLKLDKEDYDILYELYFKNTSIHQLSKQLGISRPAVRWRRDKALGRLKVLIKEYSRKKNLENKRKFSRHNLIEVYLPLTLNTSPFNNLLNQIYFKDTNFYIKLIFK